MAEIEKRSKGIDDPMCKICGHRHRFRDPHIFGKTPLKATASKAVDEALAAAKAIVANPPKIKAKGKRK